MSASTQERKEIKRYHLRSAWWVTLLFAIFALAGCLLVIEPDHCRKMRDQLRHWNLAADLSPGHPNRLCGFDRLDV